MDTIVGSTTRSSSSAEREVMKELRNLLRESLDQLLGKWKYILKCVNEDVAIV